jgi:very-short-patch-repair endonuclease
MNLGSESPHAAQVEPDEAGSGGLLGARLGERLAAVDPRVRVRILEWARKLIDLSRRNRLLVYRATKRTTLEFRLPDPDALVDRLLAGRLWLFYEPPPIDLKEPPTSVPSLDEVLRAAPPKAREAVVTQRDPLEIAKSLETISRRANAEFEDRGTHTLHLVWSLLKWTDPGSEQPWIAPIILVPVELRRPGVRERFELTPADEDPSFNPALRVKLENDFGITAPDLDLEAQTPAEFVAELRTSLRSLPQGWSIEPYAAIGLFSFAKEPMYRDLVEHAEAVAENPAVQSLALGAPVEELHPTLDVVAPTEAELDVVQKPEDMFSVLDADSSQRIAIEAANRGQSFVLYGPPGTGKSQTIANVISEAVARGRSVLFVSEKMAALEVVSKRLTSAGLGDLLLELHSSKASRATVAANLLDAVEETVEVPTDGFSAAASAIHDLRPHLNGYASALHEIRQPLGRSGYEVLAELDLLHEAPIHPAAAIDATSASPADLAGIESAVARLADVWAPVSGGDAFVWRGAGLDHFDPAERQRVTDLIDQALLPANRAMRDENVIAAAVDLPTPTSPDGRTALLELGRLARERRMGPREWLTTDDLAPYRARLERWTEASELRAERATRLSASFGPNWEAIDPSIAEEVDRAWKSLQPSVSADFERLSPDRLAATRALAIQLIDTLERIEPIVAAVRSRLGVHSHDDGLADVQLLIDVARISQARDRPLGVWLARTRLEEVEAFLAQHQPAYEEQQVMANQLLEAYEPSFLELDVVPILDRMRRHHGRWWNRLRPSHRADRHLLAAMSRTKTMPRDVIQDLETLAKLQAARDQLVRLEPEANALLGTYYMGLDTPMLRVSSAVAAARRLIDLPHDATDWSTLASKATAESPYDPGVDQVADQIQQGVDTLQRDLDSLGPDLEPSALASLRSGARLVMRDGLVHLGGRIATVASAVEAFGRLRGAPFGSVHEALADAHDRLVVASIDAELRRSEPELRATLHDRWQGLPTDWQSLEEALHWTEAVRAAYGGRVLAPQVAEAIATGSVDELPWTTYGAALDAYGTRAAAVIPLYEPEAASGAETAMLEGTFASAIAWLQRRRDDVEQLGEWVRFKTARTSLEEAGWGDFAASAVQRATPARELTAAVRRAWLDAWFRSLVAADPRLASFSRQEHEREIHRFRQADSSMLRLAQGRVLRAYESRKPQNVAIQGGEPAVIRREAAKKRRHLPVRKLLEQIPTLLPLLKPCLMMSPLSVSHFLSPDARFDLVIFDEASQVPPEDAINCIYRGRQLIVAGDENQLPPTDFFQLSATSEADTDLETSVDDFDSLLKLAQGSGFPSRPLRWHYRSYDDSLIAFSNRFIYDGSLITFPSPQRAGDALGVRFVHVPDGIFDRGGTAKNVLEARRVVDEVAAELRRDPTNSLGVVAFSSAQQEAIEDEWERRMRREPDLETLAGEGRLDGFFIKNLETVQGDERDVIIFSIGYGPDASGRILRNFGPVNRAGGWRRMNVAVTRARRKVVVVSSMRADDLRESGDVQEGGVPRGADLLRAYLEYAESGHLPELLASPRSRGPAESEFERQVAAEIRALGWKVETQVGASSYRIDIGVVSKTDSGRFVLGVECDGAMYHSAKTARDRDRLRQRVLEDLGWRIHRIWSQDWFERRSNAIARLKSTLEEAEALSAAPLRPGSRSTATAETEASALDGAPASPVTGTPPEPVRRARRVVELVDAADAGQLPWTTPYKVVTLPHYPRRSIDFHEPELTREHATRLATLAEEEGPVHIDYAATRLAHQFGLLRVGSRMSAAVEEAAHAAERSGRIHRRGPFIWPNPRRDLVQVRVPVPGQPETLRPIEHIPPEEIDLALLRVTEAALSIDEASLRTATARVLGFDRTGGVIGERLDTRLNALVRDGRLVVSNGGVVLGKSLPALPAASRRELQPGDWVRHPSFGVGRVVQVAGTVVAVDYEGAIKAVETKVVPLEPATRPE